MVSYSKQSTTVQQQIRQLKTEGLIISDITAAERFLETIAYYRLRAYWVIFEQTSNPRMFTPNTKFEDIINLYLFDEELRYMIFSAITTIDRKLVNSFTLLIYKYQLNTNEMGFATNWRDLTLFNY